MFTKLAMAVVSLLALVSCSRNSGGTAPVGRGPNAVPEQKECQIYPDFSVGNCKALVNFNDISGPDKSAYNYPVLTDPRYPVPARFIDLTQVSMETSFTKNFKVKDFMSPAKGRYGIFASHVISIIQTIRDAVNAPVQINSGYRNPSYNDGVGGVGQSRHMYGDGVDIQSSQVSTQKLSDQCRAQGASYIQLYTDGHVHCDWRNHTLDSTFYGSNQNSAIDSMSDADFLAFQYEVSGEPRISVADGIIGFENTLTFKVMLDHQEDPGEPLTEWSAHLPDGSYVKENSSEFQLKLSLIGSYEISVRSGGFVQSSLSFDVKP